MTLANALEYRWGARHFGASIRLRETIEVAILSTAANLLPLPGGPLVRIRELKRRGAATKPAAVITLALGLLWLGIASVAAGAAASSDQAIFGIAMITLGLLIGLAGLVLISRTRRESPNQPALMGAILIEGLATVATALRLWLVALSVGLDIGASAFILGVAPVIGAVVFLVPAGLGVREAVSAGLGSAVGIGAPMGFLISALDRLVGVLVHGIVAVALISVRGSWATNASHKP